VSGFRLGGKGEEGMSPTQTNLDSRQMHRTVVKI
jgi:hypothetical protein